MTKKTRKNRRGFILMLILALTLTMIPTAAFATDELLPADPAPVEQPVAEEQPALEEQPVEQPALEEQPAPMMMAFRPGGGNNGGWNPSQPKPEEDKTPLVSWFVRFDGAIVDTAGHVSSYNPDQYTGALRTSEIIEESGYDIEDHIYKSGYYGHVGALTDNASIEALASQDSARGYYIDNFLGEYEDIEALVSWLNRNPRQGIYFNDHNVTADLKANPDKYDIEWYVFKSEYGSGDYTADNSYHIDGVVVMRPETTEEFVITKTFVAPDAAGLAAAEDTFSIVVTDAEGAVITLTTDSVAGGDYNYLTSKVRGSDVAGENTVSRTYTWTLTLPKAEYTATEEAAAPAGYSVTAQIGSVSVDLTAGEGNAEFVNIYEALPPVDPPTPPEPPVTYTSVTVNKAWVLDDGGSAVPVSVQLYKDGIAEGEPVELNEAGQWTYTWIDLIEGPVYTVEEVAVPEGFTASQEVVNGVIVITNDDIYVEPPVTYTSVTVNKVWALGNGGAAVPVTVQLLDDGAPADGFAPVTLDASNNWEYTFDGLIDDGSVYTAEEVNVPENFEVSYDSFNGEVIITNTYVAPEPPAPPATGDAAVRVYLDGELVQRDLTTYVGLEPGTGIILDDAAIAAYQPAAPEGKTVSFDDTAANVTSGTVKAYTVLLLDLYFVTEDIVVEPPVDPQPPVIVPQIGDAAVRVYLDGELVQRDLTTYVGLDAGTAVVLGEAEIAAYQPAAPEGKTVSYDAEAANVTSVTIEAFRVMLLDLYFVTADIEQPPVEPPVDPQPEPEPYIPWYPPYVPPVVDPTPVDPEPVVEPVEIEEPEVPLADEPVEIEEPEVPLAEVPKTGDNMMVWAMIALLSLAGLLVTGRRKDENNN